MSVKEPWAVPPTPWNTFRTGCGPVSTLLWGGGTLPLWLYYVGVGGAKTFWTLFHIFMENSLICCSCEELWSGHFASKQLAFLRVVDSSHTWCVKAFGDVVRSLTCSLKMHFLDICRKQKIMTLSWKWSAAICCVSGSDLRPAVVCSLNLEKWKKYPIDAASCNKAASKVCWSPDFSGSAEETGDDAAPLSASTVAFPLRACGFDPNKDPAQNVPVVVLQLWSCLANVASDWETVRERERTQLYYLSV